MLLQFTTGSIEDRQSNELQVSVRNAGIQPANVSCVFVKTLDEQKNVIEHEAKIPPRSDMDILEESDLGQYACEVILRVDSPSLIVTVKSETQVPLICKVVFVDDLKEPSEDSHAHPRTVTLLWGYLGRGDLF